MFELLTFAFINLMGTMSPGPDFAMVTRYGLTGSRKAALLATCGISTALLIHISYCLLGIAYLLQESPHLFFLLQLCGSLYLGYLGIRLILPCKTEQQPEKIQKHRPFFTGFMTNLLNPKATLFILSLFSQFVTPEMPFSLKLIYASLIPLTALGWFSLLSVLLTHRHFLSTLQRYQRHFIRTMGALLLLLSLSILLSALKTYLSK